MSQNRAVNCPICGNPQELYSSDVGFMPGATSNEGKRYICSKCGAIFHVQATDAMRAWTQKG